MAPDITPTKAKAIEPRDSIQKRILPTKNSLMQILLSSKTSIQTLVDVERRLIIFIIDEPRGY